MREGDEVVDMAWATLAEVQAYPDSSAVTSGHLTLAEDDISSHTGVLTDAVLHDRDLEWLKRAVCHQAIWLAGQPGNAERTSATSVSQDGMSATLQDATAVVLAPRARRAVKNLSWMGTRSVRIEPPVESTFEPWDTVDPPDSAWTPLPAGGH
jgi:hypothetical protein